MLSRIHFDTLYTFCLYLFFLLNEASFLCLALARETLVSIPPRQFFFPIVTIQLTCKNVMMYM